MKKKLLFIFGNLLIGNLQAAEIHYRISTERSVKEMLTFSIPYPQLLRQYGLIGLVRHFKD